MTSDASVTTEERYGRAVRSSHLDVPEVRLGDVDALIAAGWVRAGSRQDKLRRESAGLRRLEDDLGPLLYRLHVEFDGVKADHSQALRNQQAAQVAIKEMAKELNCMRLAKQRDEAVIKRKGAELKAMEEGAERSAFTAHVLMLSKLKTLAPVREALWRWACVQATKQRLMQSDEVVRVLVGRVLQTHLDPLCRPCGGRGFKGGYGSPQVICRTCKGTARAQDALGKDDAERAFCGFLLREMNRMVDLAGSEIRTHLRALRSARETA